MEVPVWDWQSLYPQVALLTHAVVPCFCDEGDLRQNADRFHHCRSRRSAYIVTREPEWRSPPVPGAGDD